MAKVDFYQGLKDLTERMLIGIPSVLEDGGGEAGRDIYAIDKNIIEAVSRFASEGGKVALENDKKNATGRVGGWQGNISGRMLAEKVRNRGVSLQDFFNRYSEVKVDLLDRFYRMKPEPENLRQGLVELDVFFNGIAAGFVQEWVRAVKTAFRRRQQEAKLYVLQEKKRYATVFRRMGEPAFVVDQNMRIIDVNPAFESFFDIAGKEAIGLSCCELVGENICDGCPLEDIVESGGSFSNVEISTSLLPLKNKYSEGTRILLMAGSALGGRKEGNRGGIVIFQDITERKKNEEELDKYRNWLEDLVDERTEELLKANERLKIEIAERRYVENELIKVTASLRRSNAELEHFAHVVSHDLREPLMLIASFAERLIARYSASLNERGRVYLARIKTGTDKLQRLVDALFQMSRVVTGQPKFEPLNMNELIREVVDDLGEIVNRTGAKVEIGKLHEIDGDAVQIRQLFQNLISNALKYHKEGESPSVSIRSRLVGGKCEITVEDKGIGFDESDIEKIFEPFVRLHGRESYEGTGIGLTTCKKIVTRHDGEILVRSKPEYGTSFTVRLPFSHDPECLS